MREAAKQHGQSFAFDPHWQSVSRRAGANVGLRLQVGDILTQCNLKKSPSTKHGRPVARLVPTTFKPLSPAELYGAMAGMATPTGDLVAPVNEAWEASS